MKTIFIAPPLLVLQLSRLSDDMSKCWIESDAYDGEQSPCALLFQ